MASGYTLLGAKVLPDDATYAAATCSAGQVTAESLVEALAARDTATAEVKVNVSIHVDDAILTGAGHDSEIVGGPLTSVSAWAPEQHVEGLYTSPEFATAASR